MRPLSPEAKIYAMSRLDTFRRYQSGEMFNGDEYTPEQFVRDMTEWKPTPAILAGLAVHRVIESAGFGELPASTKMNGWTIVFDIDGELALPAAREVSFNRDHAGMKWFGRADGMDAIRVQDIKTTSSVDIDRYLESYQWRGSLWATGRRSFVYDVLRVNVDADELYVTVKEAFRIPVFAYPGMDRDVEICLAEFHAAVQSLGIIEIVRKKQMAAYMADPANLLAAG